MSTPFLFYTPESQKIGNSSIPGRSSWEVLKGTNLKQKLFSFIWNALRRLDSEKKYPENFHLVFIVKLAKYLGFAPQNSYEIYAELKNEMDTDLTDESILVDKLLTCDFETTPTMSVRQRIKILKVLLSLYQLHIEHFGNIKSLKVLNQVFR